MSIVSHELPASAGYPLPAGGPYAAELETAKALFEAELKSETGWEDQGIRDEVQLYRKMDPDDTYAVPIVMGTCVVKNCTPAQYLAVISLPGIRKAWDSRFETAQVLERYSLASCSFYSVMKGMGWLVYPRDICGVLSSYETAESIIVIQTSIEDDDNAPLQSGKTRATLSFSGWELLVQGEDIKVTYIVKVSLNGSIPGALVTMIATETPLCTGRARDVFYNIGHCPYPVPSAGAEAIDVVFQNETFSDPGPTPDDPGTLQYSMAFTSSANSTFDLIYSKRMYPDGVTASVSGGEAVTVTIDAEAGKVKVDCAGSNGEIVIVSIAPKSD